MLKTQSSLSEATERAAALLEDLRVRLGAEPPREEIKLPNARLDEIPDDLDRELQAYFSAASVSVPANSSVSQEIRDRVVEEVADRIIRAWEEPAGLRPGAIEQAVMERLIERVMARLAKDSSGSRQSGLAAVPRSPR